MSGVQSIERAFAVLRVLARGPLGVTDIAERTELPKSTVSRLLAALEHEGAVVQHEAGGGYSMGATLATLGDAASPTGSVRAMVRPFVEELALLTGGSSGFTVRDGTRARYWVDNVDDTDELVTLADKTGQSFPLHAVPTGMAMLSKLSDAELDHYLDAAVADPDEPLDDPEAVRQRLISVRADGVMLSREELDPGVNAIAAAFRGPRGDWNGAIYVQGPSFRFPDDGDEQRVVKLVTEAATQVSDRLVGR